MRQWKGDFWEGGAPDPRVDPDLVTLVIVAGVSCWLLVSLAIARRHGRVRDRAVPGLVLAAVAGVAFVVASRNDDWPITLPDAAISFAVGLLGGIGILGVPGSLRGDPWSRTETERD